MINNFSILIPYYNGIKYIKETLDSIKNQTYKNYEVIICSDNSSLHDFEKLELIAKNYDFDITVISNELNLGCGKNIQKLTETSKYDNLIVLGQDDMVSPEHLFSMNEYILRNNNLYSLIFCDAMYIDSLSDVTGMKVRDHKLKRFKRSSFNVKDLSNFNYIVSTGCCINKKILNSVGGFDLKFENCCEWITWIKLAEVYPIEINRDIYSFYRRHDSNITNSMFGRKYFKTSRYKNYVFSYVYKISDNKISDKLLYAYCLIREFSYLLYKMIVRRSISNNRFINK